MTETIANRVVSLLQLGLEQNGSVSPSDFDELKILHSRSRSSFPDEFNDLFEDIHYSGVAASNKNAFDRLIRILKVVHSLPEELQRPVKNPEVGSTALIPMFELKKAEKERILELCMEMRKIVFSASGFDQPHRVRLLDRIAAMEAETQKPKGMFDVFLGAVSDVGETLGKFGKDIKPLIDRVKEATQIARSGTKEYEQLPPPEEIKRLPPPEPENGEDA